MFYGCGDGSSQNITFSGSENGSENMTSSGTEESSEESASTEDETGNENNISAEDGASENIASSEYMLHEDITVTFFWIGEEGGEENGYIPNLQSVWDDEWKENYGGVDDPNNRENYYPVAFTPKENPFYFALPYNDFDNGVRRADVEAYIPWANETTYTDNQSMCKNRWIKIVKNDKTAYAQWQDAGPYGENDHAYVFGSKEPENAINDNAGLDVSPAVRDYLYLSDIDAVSWQFVDADQVPDGPWKNIITISQVNWK
jgi:hypothetical protein